MELVGFNILLKVDEEEANIERNEFVLNLKPIVEVYKIKLEDIKRKYRDYHTNQKRNKKKIT